MTVSKPAKHRQLSRGAHLVVDMAPPATTSTAPSSTTPPPPLLPAPAFKTEADVLESSNGLMWARLLVESFQRIVGRPLLPGLEGLDDRALVRSSGPRHMPLRTHNTSSTALCEA